MTTVPAVDIMRARSEYESADPWPHLVIDEACAPETVAAAEAEELPFARTLRAHRSSRQIKAETPVPSGPAARQLLRELIEPAFVEFIRHVTGISGLVPDPTYYWGGLYASGPGSYNAIHNDFPVHPVTKLFHRVNVLLYLNSDWSERFGGAMELWDRDLSACRRSILPVANRMVIWETDPTTYHGLPDPLALPAGRLRLALAAHFYTEERPPTYARQPLIRRPRRPQDPWTLGLARPGDLVGMVRAARSDRKRRRT